MKILEKLLLVKEITIRLVVCYSIRLVVCYSIRLVVCLLSTLKIITKIIIAVDLSKKQALDVDPKAIQQINFTANLAIEGIQESISFMKKQRKQCLNFYKEQ